MKDIHEKVTWSLLAAGAIIGIAASLLFSECASFDADTLADIVDWGVERLDEYQRGKADRKAAAGIPDAVEMDYSLGFGLVNHWTVDPEGMANAAARTGIGVIHIAYLGWGATDAYSNPSSVEEAYKRLMEATRRNRQLLFVEIANDNKGKGKYGDDHKGLDQYAEQIRQAARFIEATGYDWVQPVGETGTKAGEEFEAYCAGLFPKSALVYNGGSRPDRPASWASMFAWHPADTKTLPPKGAIAVSDHSGILRELYGDNWQGDADGNPEAIAAWAKRMRDNGNIAVLYSFGQHTPRVAELVALRTAGTKVTTPPATKPEEPAPTTPKVPDFAPYEQFEWRFGGENFSKAKPSGAVQLSLRSLSASKITYSWDKDLSGWGVDYNDHTKAIVCAFVRTADGRWVGGKFDWVSSSRKERDFKHMTSEPYKGWSLAGIPNPTGLAFVVVRHDGRDRSNVIGGEWGR